MKELLLFVTYTILTLDNSAGITSEPFIKDYMYPVSWKSENFLGKEVHFNLLCCSLLCPFTVECE